MPAPNPLVCGVSNVTKAAHMEMIVGATRVEYVAGVQNVLLHFKLEGQAKAWGLGDWAGYIENALTNFVDQPHVYEVGVLDKRRQQALIS